MERACKELSLSNLKAFLDPVCLKFCISKSLGYAIVAGSAGVKLPQVYNIVKAGNVEGLSGSTILTEMMASIMNVSYYMGLGYPFSTWYVRSEN